MPRLMMPLFSMVSTTLMGVGIVIAMTTGHDTVQAILIIATAGLVAVCLVSCSAARQLSLSATEGGACGVPQKKPLQGA
jgi:hypothetical protein